jgi:hypothetical protein
MEAVSTSETLEYFNETTRRYIPEGYHIHIRRRENMKCHKLVREGRESKTRKERKNISKRNE